MADLPKRAGAAIVKDKKMLVVSGKGSDIYWTPGGKVEKGEDLETTLRREIKEELNSTIKKLKMITSKVMRDNLSGIEKEATYYLVELRGEIKPSSEIDKIFWLSKSDFLKKKLKVSEGVNTCMHFLIERNLV